MVAVLRRGGSSSSSDEGCELAEPFEADDSLALAEP